MSRTPFGGARRPNVSAFARIEPLEFRWLMTVEYRSIDGTGNNLAHPEWGSAGQSLLRLAASAYADGLSAPAGASRPSARIVSNGIAAHPDDEMLNSRFLAAYGYSWGQFIDHDLDLTQGASPAEPFNIAVPAGDPFFDPNNTGTQVIPLNRSVYDPATGSTSPREQVNQITSFIDASMVYGSDTVRATALRTGVGGRLLTSAGNLLPYNTMGLPNDGMGGPPSSFFVAGDVRSNENIELTSMHTLFVREHNRLADQVAAANPTWTDDQIYQQARRLVAGEIQAITYNEFLPALLGAGAIPDYTGYNPTVNPGVANEFSTAAFRLGHSLLADDVEFMDNNGGEVHEEIPLAEAFFNPALLAETGIDPILKYLGSSNAEELDNVVVDGVRNFLFGQPGAGGFDLASLNIQRGRDHGLASYNDVREALGLPRVTKFKQISSDPSVRNALQSLYGSVDNIDLWVGGLAENHVAGSSLGPTLQAIVVDQFTRARDGDRFWYQLDLSGSDLTFVQNSSLADVISRNTTINNLQDNVIIFDVRISGRLFFDRNGDGQQQADESGLSNRRVDLIAEDGEVLDSATTNGSGDYDFGLVQIGEQEVRPSLPNGWQFTADATADIHVTRGQYFSNVDFGQRPRRGPMPASTDSIFASSGVDQDSRPLIPLIDDLPV